MWRSACSSSRKFAAALRRFKLQSPSLGNVRRLYIRLQVVVRIFAAGNTEREKKKVGLRGKPSFLEKVTRNVQLNAIVSAILLVKKTLKYSHRSAVCKNAIVFVWNISLSPFLFCVTFVTLPDEPVIEALVSSNKITSTCRCFGRKKVSFFYTSARFLLNFFFWF